MVADSINALLEFLGTYWPHAAGALGAGGLGSLAVFAFRRRPRPTKRESAAYFTHKTLLSPPSSPWQKWLRGPRRRTSQMCGSAGDQRRR